MIIGLDVGGTKALGLLVDPADGQVVARNQVSSHGDADALVATLVDLVGSLEHAAGHTAAALGLGIAGLVTVDGVVRYSPNLPALVEFPMADRLAEALDRHVMAVNDATAGTWAESELGAGRGTDDLAYVALGTGIGAGCVVAGRLVHGANGFAGEVGHMVVEMDGPVHHTGQRGPWEYYASGTALGRLGREAAAAGRFPAGLAQVGTVDELTGHHVVASLRAEDTDAMAVFDEFCRYVAIGLANLVMTFDPSLLVLGGGLTDIGEPLRAGVDYWLGQVTLGADHRPLPAVALAACGPDAAALGAALLATEGTR
ncbi:MAG: ROK family protein [Acidimicrobiales bacterium]